MGFREFGCSNTRVHLERCAAIVFAVAFFASTAQAQSLPTPPHIIDIAAEDNPRVKAGYLDATLYDGWNGNTVDPNGTRDSTAALQKALQDGYDYAFAVYLPAGTYLVSDTLWGNQIHATSGCA